MPTEQDEIERKYDVDEDALVPDLSGLPGVASLAPDLDLEQVATYYDTEDLRLLAAHVTLRRRLGGVDDGWHLKLPAEGDRRIEVRLPPDAGDGAVPAELLDRVRVHVRDRAVAPAAVLTTLRTIHRLLDAEGELLAELCDDRVRAESASGAPLLEPWREWELELVGAPADLLDAAEPLLVGAGARPAGFASKVSRILAERLPARAGWRERRELGTEPSTADVMAAYLAEHLLRLEEQDQQLRAGDQEGVHQLRVASRRLRSALATYARVVEPEATRRLRDDLKWLGGELGTARDAQVLRSRLGSLLDDEPADAATAQARRLVDDELEARYREGRRTGVAALDSERYFRLLDALEAFVAQPPAADDAEAPATRLLPELLARDRKRVRRRHRAVEQAAEGEQRDAALHEVRKAAKRLRYAAESARPVFGKRAKRLASRAKDLQQLLGEHQDTVVARRTLVELATSPGADDGCGLTLGRLHAREERRAEELESDYPSVLRGLPKKSPRRWLDG